jgi:type I restriction enzyme M protein
MVNTPTCCSIFLRVLTNDHSGKYSLLDGQAGSQLQRARCITTNFSQTAAYIWSLADLLRGDFKQSQYGRVILPFTILRRLECVLEKNKHAVLEQVGKLKTMKKLEEEAREKYLLRAAKESFYNTSPMDLSKLGSADI